MKARMKRKRMQSFVLRYTLSTHCDERICRKIARRLSNKVRDHKRAKKNKRKG